jgi:hypothetical protein
MAPEEGMSIMEFFAWNEMKSSYLSTCSTPETYDLNEISFTLKGLRII